PHHPAARAVRRVKFLLAFQIQISLKIAHRDDVTDLRTSPEYPRLKTAEPIARPGVTGDLLVGIERGYSSSDGVISRNQWRGVFLFSQMRSFAPRSMASHWQQCKVSRLWSSWVGGLSPSTCTATSIPARSLG